MAVLFVFMPLFFRQQRNTALRECLKPNQVRYEPRTLGYFGSVRFFAHYWQMASEQ